jgi:hypothetical protein
VPVINKYAPSINERTTATKNQLKLLTIKIKDPARNLDLHSKESQALINDKSIEK